MATSSVAAGGIVAALCGRCGLPHAPGANCPVISRLPLRASGVLLTQGTVVGGRFRIVSAAHRSGMSTVYLALDRRHDSQPVAVKELDADCLPEHERLEAVKWLAREAGLLSSLRNPHLPDLIAAFSEGSQHYIVMPYLVGETLQELIDRKGPLHEIDVLEWGRILANVLAYLHSQSPPVLHRDLKPANILVRSDGRIMLLDLGVARAMPAGSIGTAIGTPGYAPPEQYQGLADERSDLYALGATMHYLLTGVNPEMQPPFRHPPVQAISPWVSPAPAALVDRLLRLPQAARPLNSAVACAMIDDIDPYPFAVAAELYRHSLQLCAGGLAALMAVAGLAALDSNTSLTPIFVMFAIVALMLGWQPSHLDAVRIAGLRQSRIAWARRITQWALLAPLVLYVVIAAFMMPGSMYAYLAVLCPLTSCGLLYWLQLRATERVHSMLDAPVPDELAQRRQLP